MRESLRDQIVSIADMFPDSPYRSAYLSFANGETAYTREENPLYHACVYFAAYDPQEQMVFLGHHKKSGLWLFNGGHIDQGELPPEALEREISEEWGIPIDMNVVGLPQLITTTEIDNPSKQACRTHYDIWYFVPVRQAMFSPKADLLAAEFYDSRWVSLDDARSIVSDQSTLIALSEFESIFNAR